MMRLNAVAQTTPSFRLFGAWGFRGRRRNSFSSSLRDIRCQLLHGHLGIAYHGPAGTLNQPVVSFPAPRHSLRPGIRGRFRNTSQHRFGQRIHQRKQRLLAAAYPEDFLGDSIKACGDALLGVGGIGMPGQFIPDRRPDEGARTGVAREP